MQIIRRMQKQSVITFFFLFFRKTLKIFANVNKKLINVSCVEISQYFYMIQLGIFINSSIKLGS
jgi:hypothetical protein